MTTTPVLTVTDELLEELERLAENANIARIGNEWFSSADCTWWTGNVDEGDFMAGVSPATIFTLLNHIRTMQQELKAAHISVDNCELFRKDAERYQFIRSRSLLDGVNLQIDIAEDDQTPQTIIARWDRADELIDAAMTASHSS